MWSVWLIVCVSGFHSVYPLMDENKRLAEASWWRGWLWGKLGLALVGGAVLTSVQLHSLVWLFETPWTAARQTSLSITNSPSLLKLMSIESDAIQPSHPLSSHLLIPFSSCLQSFPAPGYFPMSQFFASGGQSISFSFSISPSGLISFRIDWFDFLAAQGSVSHLQDLLSKSLIQFFADGWGCVPSLSFAPRPKG